MPGLQALFVAVSQRACRIVDRRRLRAAARRMLQPDVAAIVVGLLTLAVVWWVWGAVYPPPVAAEERSYLLQARIFASGRWAASAPAMPEFFQQPNVLVTPTVASRYPPGHALLLAPGALLGAPMLVPLLLGAVTGALLFALARRLTNSSWVALLAWLVWIGDPLDLRYRPSYLSEVTTSALWLLGWWALLEWRRTRDRRWLFALAAACGLGAITRPVTMLVFALPVFVVVAREVVKRKAWRDLATALALSLAFLGVIPLWSARTTGDWRETPADLYRRDYLPFDRPGFVVDTTAPARRLTPPEMDVYLPLLQTARAHESSGLLGTAARRVWWFAREEWHGARLVLGLVAAAGLFALTSPGWFALGTSALLLLAYVPYPVVEGNAYVLEALPAFALLTAVGVGVLVKQVRRLRDIPRAPAFVRSRWAPAAAGALVVALAAASSGWSAYTRRATHVANAASDAAFQRTLEQVSGYRVVVFVRYARHAPHARVVTATLDPDQEPVWLVHDRGRVRNARLMRLVPDRVPLVYDEARRTLRVLRVRTVASGQPSAGH